MPAVLDYRPTFCLCMLFLVMLLLFLRLSFLAGLILAAILCAAFLPIFLLRRRLTLPTRVTAFAALLVLASVLGCINSIPTYLLSRVNTEEATVTVRVEDVTYQAENTLYFDGKITEINGTHISVKCKLYCYDAPTLAVGDVATAIAEVSPLPSFADADEEETYLLSCGFKATAILSNAEAIDSFSSVSLFFSRLRDALSLRLSASLSEESGALVSAILLGDRSGISPILNRNMSRLGILHLLAISGMHFTVLFIGIEKLLRRLKVEKHVRLGFVALASLFYLGLTGFSATIMRAGFMLLMMIFSFFLRTHHDTVTSLGLSAFLICLFSPYTVYHVGFWLSVLATFGILALMEKRGDDEERTVRLPLLRYVLDSVTVTTAALLMTAPLTAFSFGTLPLLTPLANLALGPLVTVLLYLAPLLLLFPNAPLLIRLAESTVAVFREGTAVLAKSDTVLTVSYPLIRVILILTAVVIVLRFCLSRQRKVSLVFPTAVLLLGAILIGMGYRVISYTESDKAEVTLFAEDRTSDGEMILVSAEGTHGVIDGSKSVWRLYKSFLRYTKEKHIHELDFYVLTSYDQAESSGFLYLMESQTLGTLYLPAPINEKEEFLLEELRERATAADTEIAFYGETAFSPSAVSLCSLSSDKNRHLSSPAFAVAYGENKILYFSASFSYNSVYVDMIAEADAVLFGGRGTQSGALFPTPEMFEGVDFFCTNIKKAPFRHTEGCKEGLLHKFILEK